MADHDPAFGDEILHVAEAEVEAESTARRRAR
jgi:hypothetical protein